MIFNVSVLSTCSNAPQLITKLNFSTDCATPTTSPAIKMIKIVDRDDESQNFKEFQWTLHYGWTARMAILL